MILLNFNLCKIDYFLRNTPEPYYKPYLKSALMSMAFESDIHLFNKQIFIEYQILYSAC